MAKKKKNPLLLYSFVLCAIAIVGLLSTQFVPQNRQATAVAPITTDNQSVESFTTEPLGDLVTPVLKANRAEQIIRHSDYSISFNSDWNIPNWVAYKLTGDMTIGDAKREESFSPDPAIRKNAVVHKDYSNSGYDRGHMAAAADFKYSQTSMSETFYTTNICPQNQNLNRGDWNDLEELVRKLARKHDCIYVCCGPVVTSTDSTIGRYQRVVVPQAFYKVLLRKHGDTYTSIGFLFPNEAGSKPLMTYAKTVDEIEQLTDIDFFPALPDDVETAVEADYNFALWTINR